MSLLWCCKKLRNQTVLEFLSPTFYFISDKKTFKGVPQLSWNQHVVTGSPTELSLFLGTRHFSDMSNHSINLLLPLHPIWGLPLEKGGFSPYPSFSSRICQILECSRQKKIEFSELRNIPRFHCWIILKIPWPMWDFLNPYSNGTWMMCLEYNWLC